MINGVIYCNLYESHILGCASSPTFLRCEPHWLLSFSASRTGFYPSVRAALAFILRSTFAQPSLILRSTFGASRTGFYPSLVTWRWNWQTVKN